jgi:hypothetical protein
VRVSVVALWVVLKACKQVSLYVSWCQHTW